MWGKVVKVEGSQCRARVLRWGVPRWGRVVKVEGGPGGGKVNVGGGCPDEARVLRWRSAHVGQGR